MIIQETTKMSEREKMAARNSNFCFLLNALYPVGSIYVSKDPTDPAELFGGSWKRIKERFIWAIGDNENPGDTGGEKTHTLTQNELPNISGKLTNFALQDTSTGLYTDGVFSIDSTEEWTTYGTGGAYSNSAILKFSAGGGQEHNNMPPWEGFYIWERIESDVPMGGSTGMLLADQTYNPESANAQSGIAVAEAVDACSPAIVITSDTGKAISIPDSSESVIKGLTAYGESTQDGTPTPDSPVEIVNIENPVINIGNQTVTVPYTFRGLKNTTTGQWSARDELRVADGKVEIVRNIKSLTITAENSDSYSFLSGNISGDICRMHSYKNGPTPLFNDMTQDASINYVLCNLFQHYKALQAAFGYEGISGTTYTGNIYINVSLTRIGLEPDTTVGDAGIRAAFWNWIKDKGCEINYILAEPVIEDITATEAGQALLALATNYPTTSVISDIDLNLTYRADTKNYIDNKIAERLPAIETAILNNI